MLRPAITQIITKNESYYSLVIGVAKRAREISADAQENSEILTEKPVLSATEDFKNNKYSIS